LRRISKMAGASADKLQRTGRVLMATEGQHGNLTRVANLRQFSAVVRKDHTHHGSAFRVFNSGLGVTRFLWEWDELGTLQKWDRRSDSLVPQEGSLLSRKCRFHRDLLNTAPKESFLRKQGFFSR
jgi:hypothetical protein